MWHSPLKFITLYIISKFFSFILMGVMHNSFFSRLYLLNQYTYGTVTHFEHRSFNFCLTLTKGRTNSSFYLTLFCIIIKWHTSGINTWGCFQIVRRSGAAVKSSYSQDDIFWDICSFASMKREKIWRTARHTTINLL